jgi:hypothetical protein
VDITDEDIGRKSLDARFCSAFCARFSAPSAVTMKTAEVAEDFTDEQVEV